MKKVEKKATVVPGILHENNFHGMCRALALKENVFQQIINQYGYPPLWSRSQSFASLIHIILEQQVSLASAKAAFDKLQERLGTITPQKLLLLTDEELKACYFSRQKTVYARELAMAIAQNKIYLPSFKHKEDELIRKELTAIKGIGNWTVDVYLLFALQRSDVFPTGDLAMMNALKATMQLPKHTTKETIIDIAENWRPYRSAATMLFWHWYIKKRNIKF